MAKTLLTQKLVIDIQDGSMTAAVLLYSINDNGSISKAKSISVKNALTALNVNLIIAEAKASAETSEAIQ